MKYLIPVVTLAISMSAFADTSIMLIGLDRPESVLVHDKALYISNQSGRGTVKDGIGWIQKTDLNGTIIEEKWVEGLNAPKGLRSNGEKLFTADIDELVMIDLKTKAMEKIKVEGAVLLNDVVVTSDGSVLVSDTYGQKIYKINSSTKEVSLLAALNEAPNGLLISGETLYVGASGKVNAARNGIEAGTNGNLSSINLSTGEQKIIIENMGYIDGLEQMADGTLLVTVKGVQSLSWVNPKDGKVIGSIAGNNPVALFEDVADIGYDSESGTIYVPNTNFHNVQILKP